MKKITLFFAFLMAAHSYAQFPAPYCGPLTFTNNVEPITLVNFAGINNTTSPTVGAVNPAHEDFTALTANVFAGSTYPITLKGNTDGNFNTNLSVFIDWNHDNDFSDAGETYNVGSIANSTGVDAVQLVGSIIVPSSALLGNTRMRVVKKYSSDTTIFPIACQAGTGFGQAEDYTVSVATASCPAPSALSALVTSATTATLSWTSGGAANSEIVVQVAGTGVPAAANDTGVNVAGTSYNATGLTAATAYEFYVRDECTLGSAFSTWTGPFVFNTTLAPGCAGLISPADGATGVLITGTTPGIPLTWTAPTTGDAPTGYNIYFGTDPFALPLLGNINALTVNITGIVYNTVYYWQAVPVNAVGQPTGCPVFSFTSQAAPGYCLNGVLYPDTTFTPTTCNGIADNIIVTDGYAGEYSNVNVTNGQTYTFKSGTTDFITIGSADGTTSIIAGVTPLTWVSNLDGVVRFYSHVSDQCGTEAVNRTRSVTCGVAPCTPPTVVFTKVSNCPVATFNVTANITNLGSATSITVTDDQGSTPQNITATGLVTFGPYANGVTVILTVANDQNAVCSISSAAQSQEACPPSNDECAGAIALTPGNNFAVSAINVTNLGATNDALVPSCQPNVASNIWYTVVVPASGSISLETRSITGSLFTDSVLVAYSGTCGTLTAIGCDDDSSTDGFFSLLNLTGRTPGEVIYISVSRFGGGAGANGAFQIAAFDGSLATTTFNAGNFKAYPNPVKDKLNLSSEKNITNVSVFNLLGQEVMTKSAANLTEIDMSQLHTGTYMVKVTADNQVKTIKVLKE